MVSYQSDSHNGGIECADPFSPIGIWDCQSSQAVIEFVRRGIAAKQDLHRICENMMDNCLASNSETGGVGCDNMTMVIVGLLHGKTKEEWYDMIAERVAKGDGPCAPPEYGMFHLQKYISECLSDFSPAQFRGPRVHDQFDDSPDEFDPTLDANPPKLGRAGRIILLGDGTEVLTDVGDEDMFDSADEEKDLESQVRKNAPASDNARTDREGTPGPQGDNQAGLTESPGNIAASPATTTEQSNASSEKESKS